MAIRARPRPAPREPGTYRIAWSGRTPGGAVEPEGRWRWVVNALDDQGQHSKVERRFYLNRTLGYLRVRPTRVVVHRRGGKLRVGFRLAHPAVVTVDDPQRARRARQDDSAPPRLRVGARSAGTGATATASALHGRVRRERAGGELVRPDRARAALPGAESPALASYAPAGAAGLPLQLPDHVHRRPRPVRRVRC